MFIIYKESLEINNRKIKNINTVKVSGAQSCLTLCDPMNCSPPGSSVQRISQARILEWVAISFSRGSSWTRDQTQVSFMAGWFFTVWATILFILRLERTPETHSLYMFLPILTGGSMPKMDTLDKGWFTLWMGQSGMAKTSSHYSKEHEI